MWNITLEPKLPVWSDQTEKSFPTFHTLSAIIIVVSFSRSFIEGNSALRVGNSGPVACKSNMHSDRPQLLLIRLKPAVMIRYHLASQLKFYISLTMNVDCYIVWHLVLIMADCVVCRYCQILGLIFCEITARSWAWYSVRLLPDPGPDIPWDYCQILGLIFCEITVRSWAWYSWDYCQIMGLIFCEITVRSWAWYSVRLLSDPGPDIREITARSWAWYSVRLLSDPGPDIPWDYCQILGLIFCEITMILGLIFVR